MANSGKNVGSAKGMVEHAAMLAALESLPSAIKPIFLFKAGEVAALLRVDTKTLQRKRAQRERAAEAGEEIDGIDIASIPFAPISSGIRYSAAEIESYLRRVSQATGASANPFGLTRSAASSFMGFQIWMSTATPVDDWPFTIARDGRPMDLAAAIILGQTTGEASRMTLRQFAEASAHLSGRDFQDEQSRQIEAVTARPAQK